MAKNSGIMKAVVLHSYERGAESIDVEAKPIPTLESNEVLIKIAAAPINPSDLMFIRGLYGIKKKLPTIPGFEGSGTVVAAGSGLMAKFLLGKRVACVAPSEGNGTWAEYMKAPALTCFPLSDRISDEEGATLFVNPLTAWAFLERIKGEKTRAFVQTAVGSQLGRMLWRLAEAQGIPSIGLVRRKEQQTELTQLGMKNVLCTQDSGIENQLSSVCSRLGAHLAFDAVGGETTELLMNSMPKGSRVILYGGLSLQNPTVSIHSLIFGDKKLEGFWLSEWIQTKNLIDKMRMIQSVRGMIGKQLKSEIRASYSFDNIQVALDQYEKNMSGGKIVLHS